jgi:hypothetical protein
MRKCIISVLLLCAGIVLTLHSCTFFETRSPEEPNTAGTVFIPPTSPDIVVDNFVSAITSLDADNYVQCFAENYTFAPSAAAVAMYPSLFDGWSANDERQFLVSLKSLLGSNGATNFVLQGRDWTTLNTDSAILVTRYDMDFDYVSSTLASSYSGTLALTIVPTSSGLWAISKWQDFALEGEDDTLPISFLKASIH